MIDGDSFIAISTGGIDFHEANVRPDGTKKKSFLPDLPEVRPYGTEMASNKFSPFVIIIIPCDIILLPVSECYF